MRILVLGGTGGTGRAIIQRARSVGYDVNVLVRLPKKARDLDGTTLFTGDARDPEALTRALASCEAVASALGTGLSPFRKVTLLSTATAALVGAMQRSGVKRLACITGIGAGDSRGHGGFIYSNLVMPLLLRNVYADKDRQERTVRESGLDWVLVRPSALNDKPARGSIRAFTDLSGFNGGTISREDVATFVVDQFTSNAWLHKTPLITW